MSMYELIFEVEPLSDETTEAVYDALDALIVVENRGPTLIECSAEGCSAIAAAKDAVNRLNGLGVHVKRLYEDLVTRGEIAERAGVTPQAVGLWVRGERHPHAPFPAVHNHVAGGVWLWSEVNSWLAALDKADGLCYPQRVDYQTVNLWLADRHARHHFGPAWEVRPAEVTAATHVEAFPLVTFSLVTSTLAARFEYVRASA